MDEIIRQAQQGSEVAFEQLLNDCYDRMYHYALKWAGNRANAEDITHQACLKLTRGLSQFRFESSFNTWLYRLVVNCALDWQKAHLRHTYDDIETADLSTTSYGNAEADIHLRQVLTQIEKLGEGYRETVLLVFGEGLSHREAGEVLNVRESTISWRIHEIRKRLNPVKEGGSK